MKFKLLESYYTRYGKSRPAWMARTEPLAPSSYRGHHVPPLRLRPRIDNLFFSGVGVIIQTPRELEPFTNPAPTLQYTLNFHSDPLTFTPWPSHIRLCSELVSLSRSAADDIRQGNGPLARPQPSVQIAGYVLSTASSAGSFCAEPCARAHPSYSKGRERGYYRDRRNLESRC